MTGVAAFAPYARGGCGILAGYSFQDGPGKTQMACMMFLCYVTQEQTWPVLGRCNDDDDDGDGDGDGIY